MPRMIKIDDESSEDEEKRNLLAIQMDLENRDERKFKSQVPREM
jgi:hypothetical protein